MVGKRLLAVDSADTLQVKKFRQNRSISHCFQDKCIFTFYAEIQNGRQNGRKTIFGKSRQYILQIPWESKMSLKSLYLAPFTR